jgi:prophage regulatory protein
MTKRIVRLPVVMGRTSLSRSSIYAGIAEGTFPAQIPLGGRAVGWDEDEVNGWIKQRAAEAEDHASMHVNKAAEVIGIPHEELQPFIDSGELPTYQLGRHQLVKKTVLAAFRKKHAATLQGEAA